MTTSAKQSMQEFFNFWSLLAVFIFALNNFYLKQHYHNWLTGKLSDITVCYFLPLYVSAVLALTTRLNLKHRLLTGCVITLLVFSAVKVLPEAADLLNRLLSLVTEASQLGPSRNLADPSDLIALPMIALAYWMGLHKA